MKKILITGGCGFIGSNLTNFFLKKKVKVIVLDKYNFQNSYGWLENSRNNKNLKVELGDVRDFDFVNNVIKNVDSVIHLAALIGIPYSYVSPLAYIQTNLVGTYNILESCKINKIKNTIITSTSEVYGSSQYEPMDENHPTFSQSPYAASKNAADELAKSYYNSFDLPVKIIRPFNTFGPRQSARAVIPNIIFQLTDKRIKNVKLGNLSPKRDYTYVDDLCEAYYKIYNLKKFGEVYNVGTEENISIGDLYKVICKIMKIKKKIKVEKKRKRKSSSEVSSLRSNFNKLNKSTGWKPTTNLINGLKKTIIWIKNNQNIYKDIYNI